MQETDLVRGMAQWSSLPPDRMALRNILVATDFSECSTRAVTYALGIARRYEAPLHLFHWIDPTPYNFLAPDTVQRTADDARRELEQLALNLRDRGTASDIQIKVVVETGDLVATLSLAASDLDLGLIIVGTHGRTGWRKAALGSVAEVVIDKAPCPVLSVGPSADRTRIQKSGPERILLAIEACSNSQLARSYAFSLVRKYRSGLTVVDVIENRHGRVLAEVSQLEWREAEPSNTALEKTSVKPEQLPTEIGTESDLILQVADQTAADLIVLDVPEAHKFTHRFVSTSSYRVVCSAPCPVLTVTAQTGRDQ